MQLKVRSSVLDIQAVILQHCSLLQLPRSQLPLMKTRRAMDSSLKTWTGLFFVIVFVTLAVAADPTIQGLKWRLDPTFNDQLPNEVDATSSSQEHSRMDCARKCSSHEACNNFFYNRHSNLCLLERMVYVALASSHLTSAPGWRLYRLAAPAGPQYHTDRLSGCSYKLEVDKFLKWTSARDRCVGQGDTLVVLEPVIKAHFVADFLNTNTLLGMNTDIYIGAERPVKNVPFPDSGPDFQWVDGQPVNVTATSGLWENPEKPYYHSGKGALVMRKNFSWRWSEARHASLHQHCMCQRPFPQ